ncbi:MAG: PQQ-dependent sugar dehydrogenase, partial [Acidobacteria bacterium]|nr:PQQ-dependent sugar dehydrogenase [Acidobacteriota bacterium]
MQSLPYLYSMKRTPLLFLIILFGAAASIAGATEIRLTPIVSGLQLPVALVQPNDTPSRMLVAEARGVIQVIEGEGIRPQPFFDIRDRVIECCENGGGLLSFVLDPDFPADRSFYVLYVDLDGNTVLSRFQADATGSSGIPSSEEILFVVDQPEEQIPNHHGGDLHFGPDGFLYITVGDGGTESGVTERAQELWHFMGKVLRLDVQDARPYAIPPDNPFVEVDGARAEIWAYGLRNPWRFSIDSRTGDMWIGDVGQSEQEEIDVLPASHAGGANFGWGRFEGTAVFNAAIRLAAGTAHTRPRLTYGHDGGACSV